MKISLIRAEASDAETIWAMQKRAFAEMLEKYRDYETSPAAEPLSKTETRLSQPFTYFYFISVDSVNVGAVRIIDKHDGTRKRISPLFILPDYRRRSYAMRAVEEAEKIHGRTGWELDTVLQEEAACRLYEKLGYQLTGERKTVNPQLTLVYYEK
ncbi:MAG: GNAT family N-acetyltransferase [Clostridia bacterium]|nr:GNAT family N-acetyltransferase [Clostridia bacterium]